MSRISCPHMKRILLMLPLLLLLAFFLMGCAKGTHDISGTTNQGSSTTNTQSSSTADTTNVKNGDQQVQNLLQSLDNAQKDAVDASNSGDQQDASPVP
jgi:hypothetical protein